MQNHYNLMVREEEREMLPLCAAEGIGVIPWSPLARGRLTRDWDESSSRSETDQGNQEAVYEHGRGDRGVVERVAEIARKRGVPRAQVALAWLLEKPPVTAPDRRRFEPHHLDDAVAALSLGLTGDEITALEEPYVPHPIQW